MLDDPSPAHRYRRRQRRARRFVLLASGAAGAAATSLVLAVHGGASGGAAHVTVHRGDTLWAIAAAHYPGDDVQAWVQQIEVRNHLKGAAISPGQLLTLPEL